MRLGRGCHPQICSNQQVCHLACFSPRSWSMSCPREALSTPSLSDLALPLGSWKLRKVGGAFCLVPAQSARHVLWALPPPDPALAPSHFSITLPALFTALNAMWPSGATACEIWFSPPSQQTVPLANAQAISHEGAVNSYNFVQAKIKSAYPLKKNKSPYIMSCLDYLRN